MYTRIECAGAFSLPCASQPVFRALTHKEWRTHVPPAYNYREIAKMIDHSLLNPALTTKELEDGIQLAVRYNVGSVCILPYYLQRAAQRLAATSVVASTTIGFPHGGHTTTTKVAEAKQALADG